MDTQDIRQCIARVEECADQAKNLIQAGNVPQDLRQVVETLHQQARDAKKGSGVQDDENGLRQRVLQLEQTADQARDACQRAGNVDPQLQQAILRAHDELSKLKKQMQAGSPA